MPSCRRRVGAGARRTRRCRGLTRSGAAPRRHGGGERAGPAMAFLVRASRSSKRARRTSTRRRATLRRGARAPGGGARLAAYAPRGGSSVPSRRSGRARCASPRPAHDALLRVVLQPRGCARTSTRPSCSCRSATAATTAAARRARATTRFATADITHCTALSNGAVASVTSGFGYEVLVVPWVEADCDEWEGRSASTRRASGPPVTLPGPVGQLSGGDLLRRGGHRSCGRTALSVDTDTHETRR